MKIEELKNGMFVKHRETGNVYLVIDAKKGSLFNFTFGSTCLLNRNNYLYESLVSGFDILWDLNDIVSAQSKKKEESKQNKVYIVETGVDMGMEFAKENYFNSYNNIEDAKKWFESEKKHWFNQLSERYCNEGESVTIYNVGESEVEIYADEDHKDFVHIKLVESKVK